MPPTDLRLDEADELLAAWVCARADSHGIRVLVIKGRPLADDGLRAPRVSSDVDLLVEPARFDEYCALLVDAGWEEFPSTYAAAHFTLHSLTYRKSGWPNSLDVHSDFPGFLHEPDVAFEALWATRRTTPFAHRRCPVPSRAGNALILGLHSLRGTHRQPRHADELAQLERATFTPAERRELASLAAATGAAEPLRGLLTTWGVAVAPAPEASATAGRALRGGRRRSRRDSATPRGARPRASRATAPCAAGPATTPRRPATRPPCGATHARAACSGAPARA